MRHWKHSKFVKWVRGYEKPYALTWEGWDDWNRETRAKYPIRFWFAEDFVPEFQRVVTWPYKKLRDIRYYINNRWVTRSHTLTSTLAPGRWYDMDTRLLNCMFDELVNFVEVEQAHMQVIWGDKETKEKYPTPSKWTVWFRNRTWRCAEAGIDRLTWAAELEEQGQPTEQALGAREILELYRWWKYQRPERRDPHDVSGWSKICATNDDIGLSNVPRHIKDSSMKVMQELERKYDREDEQMMIRLIKVRRHLWT